MAKLAKERSDPPEWQWVFLGGVFAGLATVWGLSYVIPQLKEFRTETEKTFRNYFECLVKRQE